MRFAISAMCEAGIAFFQTECSAKRTLPTTAITFEIFFLFDCIPSHSKLCVGRPDKAVEAHIRHMIDALGVRTVSTRRGSG